MMDSELTRTLTDMARDLGAVATGVTTVDTLAGGPPSADLAYVLPGARSAVSFAVVMDGPSLESFLGKKDRISHESDNLGMNILSGKISYKLSKFLVEQGHAAAPLAANGVWRDDEEHAPQDAMPPISHKYLAIRSGIGHLGLSGNFLMKEYGATVILGSVVTDAELVPTDPLPPEENYCDDCGLCREACVTGFMSTEEKSTVTLGGVEFSYTRRRSSNRCGYGCSGFTGLHPSGKWSTWSPGRFAIPEEDDELPGVYDKARQAFLDRPENGGGFQHPSMPGKPVEMMCGNCQLVCHPDKTVRAKRFKMLTRSGVIIQHPDGSLVAVSPEKAEEHLAAMTPETRALYEEPTE
jgi:epoxyqueuosine reductase